MVDIQRSGSDLGFSCRAKAPFTERRQTSNVNNGYDSKLFHITWLIAIPSRTFKTFSHHQTCLSEVGLCLLP